MSNLQASKHQYQSSSAKRDLSLFYSILVHLLLACGLYYISQPKIPKETPNLEAMIVTPDMLKSMQAQAASASDGAEEISVKTRTGSGKTNPKPKDTPKTTPKNDMSLEELNKKLAAPKAKNALIEKKLVNKTTREEIKPKTPPKEKSVFKPKATKKTEVKKDKADKILEQNKKNREAFEKKKRQAEREKQAFLKKQRQEAERREKQREDKLKKEKQAEKQRLKELKAKEKEQAKRQEERRQKIAKERAKAEERRKAEAAANAKKQSSGTASLDGGKSTGSKKSDTNNANASSKTGLSNAEIESIAQNYYNKIHSKIRLKLNNKTKKTKSIRVRIRLSKSGRILSLTLLGSTGDKALDKLFYQAVMDSNPLPVPKERQVYNKKFKTITLDLGTS